MTRPRLLNFGCGSTLHAAWVNVDAAPAAPGVLKVDLRRGFPFGSGEFDAAYGSHVLEHLPPAEGEALLRECRRVLKPEGILRIAVPDLETIAGLYLEATRAAAQGDAAARERYDWLMLELYDQSVRARSGGEMQARLSAPRSAAEQAFIESRIGAHADGAAPVQRGALALACAAFRRGRRLAARAAAFVLLGRDGAAALEEGLFRRSGEVHQWMYDRFSLGRALEKAGFTAVTRREADDSDIPGFAAYGLERREGRVLKPDSLFMEGRRAPG
jgi:SAM-dependent methyltransferase